MKWHNIHIKIIKKLIIFFLIKKVNNLTIVKKYCKNGCEVGFFILFFITGCEVGLLINALHNILVPH